MAAGGSLTPATASFGFMIQRGTCKGLRAGPGGGPSCYSASGGIAAASRPAPLLRVAGKILLQRGDAESLRLKQALQVFARIDQAARPQYPALVDQRCKRQAVHVVVQSQGWRDDVRKVAQLVFLHELPVFRRIAIAGQHHLEPG